MRRSRLLTLVTGVLMAAFLLPSAAVAATPSTTTQPTISLGCTLTILVPNDYRPAVVCKWTAPVGVTVKEYRVWRIVDSRPRRLIATVAPDATLRHADRAVYAGHTYRYRVAAIGDDGTRVAYSKLVSVRYARTADRIRFDCAFIIDGARQGVTCNWGKSMRAAAVRYVLFRSVDGGPRQAIYRTGIKGRRSFLDTNVVAGQTIRYGVLVLAPNGRIVGVGGPDSVTVPTVTIPTVAG